MDALKKAIRELRKEQAKEKAIRRFNKPVTTFQEYYQLQREQRELGLLPPAPPKKRRKVKAKPRPKAKKRRGRNLSPSQRPTPWKTMVVGTEQHVMLRELAEHYQQSLGGMAGLLIEEEYFLLLREIDPEKARIVEERYAKEQVSRKLNPPRGDKGRFITVEEANEQAK